MRVWDAVIAHRETARTTALFRCTRIVRYAKPGV
jgi:hypothetical protein